MNKLRSQLCCNTFTVVFLWTSVTINLMFLRNVCVIADEKARLQLSDCSTADTNNKTSKNSNPAVRHDILSKIRKDAEKEEYVQFVYDVITVYGRNFTEKFFPEIYT